MRGFSIFLLIIMMSSTFFCSPQAAPPIDPAEMDFSQRIVSPEKHQKFAMDGWFVWGGNTVRAKDGRYHLFVSRWPERTSMGGWITHSQIVRAVSEYPEGPFEFAEELSILKSQSWAEKMVHNPTVFEHNGMYYLAYIGAHWAEQDGEEMAFRSGKDVDRQKVRYTQRIGLATAPDAAGPWTPLAGNPILNPRVNSWDSTFVTNPSICITPENKILMMYKSTRGLKDPLLLGLTQADQPEGPYVRIGREPMFEHNIEDPFVWHEDGWYWMLTKDMTGEIGGERHAGLLYMSTDGIDWELAPNVHSYSKQIAWADGVTEEIHRMERPQLLIENGRPVCFYTAILPEAGGVAWNLARRIVAP